MLTRLNRLRWAFAFVMPAALVGCAATGGESASDEEEPSGQATLEIVGGQKASAYPEAVLVNLISRGELVAYCSGSLIAPRVVLTAGHCVHGTTEWKVTAPYARSQKAFASRGATFDWTTSSHIVDPGMHDIGLVFLNSPIAIADYPTLLDSPLPGGASIVNIGRIDSGTLSTLDLFVSKPTTVEPGAASGYSYDYVAKQIIESGDSGGPDIQPGTHTIVAINSGAGGGTEVLARVDLVYDWIQTQIAEHRDDDWDDEWVSARPVTGEHLRGSGAAE